MSKDDHLDELGGTFAVIVLVLRSWELVADPAFAMVVDAGASALLSSTCHHKHDIRPTRLPTTILPRSAVAPTTLDNCPNGLQWSFART
jgi:hypothetical protein